MTYYRQCILQKNSLTKTAWLPEKFAKFGKYLELQEDDYWDDGWLVITVSKARLDEKQLIERSQDYKKTRNASHI
jgi:hypothetical protein